MNMQSGIRLAKVAAPVAVIMALLSLSPATRERIITTAHAAAQRVLVVNKDDRPVSVTQAPRRLFQERIQVDMVDTATSASANFQVPNGRRLILENIGGKGAAEGVNYVEVTQSGESAFMRPVSVNLPGSWKWIGTTPTKVVFEAGDVSVWLRRPSAQSGCTGCTKHSHITLTGYLLRD